MDFLEPGFGGGRGSATSLKTDYRASFATQNNQMGRLWPGGVNTGGWTSKNSEEPAEMPFANELGEDGWEMFQVVQYALNSCYYFRKVI